MVMMKQLRKLLNCLKQKNKNESPTFAKEHGYIILTFKQNVGFEPRCSNQPIG
jgi:hypothetical protein